MADLSRNERTNRTGLASPTDRADRAQLILVGGVVVALALVALVLLLNTALFAENIATRGLGPGPDRASAHASFTDRATERVLRGEERIEYESWAEAEANATRNVRRLDEAVRARQLQEHGALATINATDVNRGAVLVQNDTGRGFVSEDGNANWTLAETGGIRNYTMTVETSGTLASPTDVSDAFTIRVENDTDVWEAYVYASGSDTVVVDVSGKTCESDASVATINWTGGTLAGCTFPFATDGSGAGLDGPYTLSYRNGDEAAGTYHVTVRNGSPDTVETDNFDDPGATTSPRYYHAVYSLHLRVGYEGSTTDYDTHVRAAPGESDNTSPS